MRYLLWSLLLLFCITLSFVESIPTTPQQAPEDSSVSVDEVRDLYLEEGYTTAWSRDLVKTRQIFQERLTAGQATHAEIVIAIEQDSEATIRSLDQMGHTDYLRLVGTIQDPQIFAQINERILMDEQFRQSINSQDHVRRAWMAAHGITHTGPYSPPLVSTQFDFDNERNQMVIGALVLDPSKTSEYDGLTISSDEFTREYLFSNGLRLREKFGYNVQQDYFYNSQIRSFREGILVQGFDINAESVPPDFTLYGTNSDLSVAGASIQGSSFTLANTVEIFSLSSDSHLTIQGQSDNSVEICDNSCEVTWEMGEFSERRVAFALNGHTISDRQKFHSENYYFLSRGDGKDPLVIQGVSPSIINHGNSDTHWDGDATVISVRDFVDVSFGTRFSGRLPSDTRLVRFHHDTLADFSIEGQGDYHLVGENARSTLENTNNPYAPIVPGGSRTTPDVDSPTEIVLVDETRIVQAEREIGAIEQVISFVNSHLRIAAIGLNR